MPYITDLFLPICNSENGDFIHLPFQGALADQPYMTMQVLILIQTAYKQVLSDKAEKMKAKIGSGRTRGHARRRR